MSYSQSIKRYIFENQLPLPKLDYASVWDWIENEFRKLIKGDLSDSEIVSHMNEIQTLFRIVSNLSASHYDELPPYDIVRDMQTIRVTLSNRSKFNFGIRNSSLLFFCYEDIRHMDYTSVV